MQENSKTGKYIKNMYLQAIFKGKLLLQKKKTEKSVIKTYMINM